MVCINVIWLLGCHLLSNCRYYLCHILGTADCSLFYRYSFRKQNHILYAYLFLFLFFPQQLLKPLAHFHHILERKVDFLGIVSCSSLSEYRRGENRYLYIRESVLYVSFRKVQTGNPALLLLLIVELLDFHGLPSLELQVFTLISASKDRNNWLQGLPWVCYLQVLYKIKDTSRGVLRSWGCFCLLCGENASRIHLLVSQL